VSARATVTQADRDAAASITAMAELREMVAGGDYDEHAYVQAFARHRRATAAEFATREAALVEALERIAAPALVSLDELPNGWRNVAVERIDIARAVLARARTTSEGDG